MNPMSKQVQAEQDVIEDSACGQSDCCTTTDDGRAVCMVSENVEAVSWSGNSVATIQPDSIETVKLLPSHLTLIASDDLGGQSGKWQQIRGIVMFGIACLASPCCTPLIVPVVLALLAGTPAAIWMGQNLGVVYGGLTLVSVVSLVLAWRLIGKNGSRRAHSPGIPSSAISETTMN